MELVFSEYAREEDGGNSGKIRILARKATTKGSNLVSRAHARSVLEKLDRFKTVVFDFDQLDYLGPSFADEIFRVYQSRHPEMKLEYVNACKDVENMIRRALALGREREDEAKRDS